MPAAVLTLDNLVKKATLIGAPICINQDESEMFYAFIMCSGVSETCFDSEEALVQRIRQLGFTGELRRVIYENALGEPVSRIID